jgi:hypothetical protein
MRAAPLLVGALACVGLALRLDASYICSRLAAKSSGRPVSAQVVAVHPLPPQGGQAMDAVELDFEGARSRATAGPGLGLKAGDRVAARQRGGMIYLEDDGGFTAKRLALLSALCGVLMGLTAAAGKEWGGVRG